MPDELGFELYPALGDCAPLSINVRRASAGQTEAGLWALADESFGVDPTDDAVFSLDLGDVHWLAAFDRSSIRRLTELPEGEAACVLGVITEADLEEPNDFSLSCVLLVERGYRGGRVAGFDRQGAPALAGSVEGCESGAFVRLRAVAKPEWPPVELDVELLDDGSACVVRAEIAPGLTQKARLAALQ